MLQSILHDYLVFAETATSKEEAPHKHPVKSSAVVHDDKDGLIRG